MQIDNHFQSQMSVLLAGVLWSMGGPLIRLLDEASEWQFLCYRSVSMLLILIVILKWKNQNGLLGSFCKAGWTGVVGGIFLALAFIAFLFSITHTTVANTLFMMSTSPFLAALMSWLLLRERLSRVQWVSMTCGGVGIGIMISDGVVSDGLFGIVMGLTTALGFAAFSTSLRFGKSSDMLPTVCYAGVFSAIGSAIVATVIGQGLQIPIFDVGIAVVYGSIGMGLGMVFFIIGSRRIDAAELTLLSLSEVVLGPIWALLFFAEYPSFLTVVGGSILLMSLIYQSLAGARLRNQALKPNST